LTLSNSIGRRLLAVSIGLSAITTGAEAQLRDTELSTRQARLDFATSYPNKQKLEELLKRVTNSSDVSRRSEILLMLMTMPASFEKSSFIETLRKKGGGKRPSDRTLAVLDYESSIDRDRYRKLKARYPFDYAILAHFLFISFGRGSREENLSASLEALEKMTDHHPMTLYLRARHENFILESDPKFNERLGKALVFYKLYRSARLQIGDAKRVNEEIKLLEAFLRKKGIATPEPTAEEYAAVKKRGWAFNKQMLEPFKKVE